MKNGHYRLEVVQHIAQESPITLVFLHGGCHTAACWQQFQEWFARRGFSWVAPNLRGHGASAGRQGLAWYRLNDYVEDLYQVLERVQEPFLLVGHSMGGGLAQRLLCDIAQGTTNLPKPLGVVLLASATPAAWRMGLRPQSVLRHPGELIRALLKRDLHELVRDPRRVREYYFCGETEEDRVLACMRQLQGESIRVTFWDALHGPIAGENGPPNTIPVQVWGGREDTLIPPPLIEATAKAYGVPATFFPGGHDMMLDVGSMQVAEAIEAFARTLICGTGEVREKPGTTRESGVIAPSL
jgi:pimeloyl-ACP methyl ester carboxylesterase